MRPRLLRAVVAVLLSFLSSAAFADDSGFTRVTVDLARVFSRDVVQTLSLRHAVPTVYQPSVYEPLFIIPIVGNTAGANGTFFKSNLHLRNILNTDQPYTIVFLQANSANAIAGGVVATLPAHTTRYYGDIMTTLGVTGLGALVVFGSMPDGSLDTNARLSGFSKIYTPIPGLPGGQASQAFPSIGPTDLNSTLSATAIGAQQDSNFRANIGIFNFSSQQQTFAINVGGFASSAGNTQSNFTMTVPAFSIVQQRIPSDAQGALRVTISPVAGAQFYYTAYVSSNDNVSGDSWSALFSQELF